LGCLKLKYHQNTELKIVYSKKELTLKNTSQKGYSNYFYAFQGQEKDAETGMEVFELRLWDARIGRWLTPDPMREFSSPYLGIGNNPINKIDPDGGKTDDWVSKDGGKSFYWDHKITSEEQALAKGLTYGGKTVPEAVARTNNWFENLFDILPNFDMKSYYDPLVKQAYFEALGRYMLGVVKNSEELERARTTSYEAYMAMGPEFTFDAVDLSFANQFKIGKEYASYNTVLEYNNQSYEVTIRIQRVHEKNRSADRLLMVDIPPNGNSSVNKQSTTNWYQHRLGKEAVIRVIFGQKNEQGWRTIGRD